MTSGSFFEPETSINMFYNTLMLHENKSGLSLKGSVKNSFADSYRIHAHLLTYTEL